MNLHNEAALLRYRRQRPQRRMDGGRATSVFHAAIYYCGACAGRSGGPRVPTGATIITVRVDGREYRVREGRVREWANARAEQDAERRKAAGKNPRRA